MKSAVVAIGLAVAAAAIAPAAANADEPAYRGTSYVGPYNWGGLYFGSHFGVAVTDLDVTNDGPGVHFYNPGQVYNFSDTNVIGGAQVGLQHQFGRVVLGGELSWTARLADDKLTAAGPFATNSYTTDVDSLVTAAAKLGYAWDKWLAYVKGGYASAVIRTTANEAPAFPHSGNSSERHNGWLYGGGLEYALTSNFIFGVEYNWIDLDAKTHIGTDSIGFAPYNVRVDPDIHTVTARLSFKFGRDAPAAPLK